MFYSSLLPWVGFSPAAVFGWGKFNFAKYFQEKNPEPLVFAPFSKGIQEMDGGGLAAVPCEHDAFGVGKLLFFHTTCWSEDIEEIEGPQKIHTFAEGALQFAEVV